MTAEEFRQRTAALARRAFFANVPPEQLEDLPAGWLGLVESLADRIEALPQGASVRCSDVKEKLGALRVGLEDSPPSIAQNVAQAIALDCEMSTRTCCVCGCAGRIVRPHGWYYCLCPDNEHLSHEQLRRAVHPWR